MLKLLPGEALAIYAVPHLTAEDVIRSWAALPIMLECKYVSNHEVSVYIKLPTGLRYQVIPRAMNERFDSTTGYSRLALDQSAGEHFSLESPLNLADLAPGPIRIVVGRIAQGLCCFEFYAPYSVNIKRSQLDAKAPAEKTKSKPDVKLQSYQQKVARLEQRTKMPMSPSQIENHQMHVDLLVTDIANEFDRIMQVDGKPVLEDNKLHQLRHLHGRAMSLKEILAVLKINVNHWLLERHPHFVNAARDAMSSQEFERVSRKAESAWRLHKDAMHGVIDDLV